MKKSKYIVPVLTAPLVITAIYVTFKLVTYNSQKYISTWELGYDKPGEFFNYYKLITTPIGRSESGYKTNYRFYELNKAKEIIVKRQVPKATKL